MVSLTLSDETMSAEADPNESPDAYVQRMGRCSRSPYPALRRHAAQRLAAEPHPDALPVVLALLEDADVAVLAEALRAAQALARPLLVPWIEPLAHHADATVRERARALIAELMPQPAPESPLDLDAQIAAALEADARATAENAELAPVAQVQPAAPAATVAQVAQLAPIAEAALAMPSAPAQVTREAPDPAPARPRRRLLLALAWAALMVLIAQLATRAALR